jgi:amino acid transporter
VLANLNILYLTLNIGSALAVIIGLAATGPHVSAEVAFTQLTNGSGWSNNGMAFLLSLTSVMWTHTGYDSAVHVAEETKNAAKTAPLAIMSAVFGTSFMGFALAIVTSFAISDVEATATTALAVPMAQVLYDHLGKKGMLALWSFIIVVQVNTAAAQLVDASRVVFAFSRDGALPGSRYWSRVNGYTKTPVLAVFFVVLGAAVLGLLTLQATAALALFSCAVIALYISYAIPIYLRLMSPDFQRGQWHMGRFSRPIAGIAVAWVSFITIGKLCASRLLEWGKTWSTYPLFLFASSLPSVLLFPPGLDPGIVDMNWAILIRESVPL